MPGNFCSGRQAEDSSGNWCRSYIEHSIEPNVRSPFLSFGSFVHHMHHETSLLQLKMLVRLQLLIKFIQWMLLGVHKEKAAIKWKWLSKKKKLPKFTFKFKLLYVTLFYSFVSLMDIIIWLFSTAKNSKVFYLFLKKVFATQQKLVEKMFNMLSKYNAGIWVKKTNI